MRRTARWWGRGLLVASCLRLAAARAQTVPALVVIPAARPRPDSLKPVPPTFVVDTTRHVVVVAAVEPTDSLTRRSALRIGAVIVVLTLTTLLLYNVRSR